MAKVILTDETIGKQLSDLPPEAQLWVYCAWDCCTPQEAYPQVEARLTDETRDVRDFELTCAALASSMAWTGVKVDEAKRLRTAKLLETQRLDLEVYVQALFQAFWGKPCLVSSPQQLAQFFYFAEDGLQLRPRYERRKAGKPSVTTNRKALESIAQEYYYAEPLVSAILEIKDLTKRLEFLNRGVDSDGRVRCTFSPASTDTGRWSSYKNPWGRGGNFQNQSPEVREIYVPDSGMVFAAPDLRQAESFGVAYYSGDERYIEAVESGDLHTQVARMVWPDKLPWTGDLKRDKHIAKAPYYRHFTHRDISKRAGHATNYNGQAKEVSAQIKVPIAVVQGFQDLYRTTFPGIFRWHEELQARLITDGFLTSPLGRKRVYYGRRNDSQVLKKAIACLPQGLISDIFKIGLLRIWLKYEMPWGQDPNRPVRIYADIHDGGLIGVKADLLDQLVPDFIRLMTVPVRMPHGVMSIPVEFPVGWRWIKDDSNPLNMREWEPGIVKTLGAPPDSDFDLLDLPPEYFQRPAW